MGGCSLIVEEERAGSEDVIREDVGSGKMREGSGVVQMEKKRYPPQ